MKRLKSILFPLFLLGLLIYSAVICAAAGSISESTYVSFAPDGTAWTTCAGDTETVRYEDGTVVYTGKESALRSLQTGEHYYKYDRKGSIPVGRWQVEWENAQCIHSAYPAVGDHYHGITFRREKCLEDYHSGWLAYCADCDGPVADFHIYMHKAAAETIDSLEAGVGQTYYYLCPHCSNLEQGCEIGAHICKQISWNQYRVVYNANSGGAVCRGYMEDSYHIYNNAEVYNGRAVTPVTHLTKNSYSRTGYEFLGWNTESDGSGIWYEDEAEICNLTTYDCFEDGLLGRVVLYAQWKRSESTLGIDPAGGTYMGKKEITELVREYGTMYELEPELLKAPDGAVLSFVVNGGEKISPVTGTQHFTEWIQEGAFNGRLLGNLYYFIAGDGNVDRIRACYTPDEIILPSAEKANSSFGGWYYDAAFEKPAGGPGDAVIIEEDTVLYAQWVELRLSARDNYVAASGKGAVDLRWEQPDKKNKAYKLYQSTDTENWKQIYAGSESGTSLQVSESFGYSGSAKTYTVPYTGIYRLTAYGAQGGRYGNVAGGKGGMAAGSFWLNAGDVLTFYTGGQSGYPDGGSALLYGGGGGSTSVVSSEKGLLLKAGGGGGATPLGTGGAGGSSQSLRTDGKSAGEAGQAGGGGGAVGGKSGEAVFHKHTEACYVDTSRDILYDASIGAVVSGTNNYEEYVQYNEDEGAFVRQRTVYYGSAASPIAVNGCDTLLFEGAQSGFTDADLRTDKGLRVYNQNGQLIYYQTHSQLQNAIAADRARAVKGNYSASWDNGFAESHRNFSYYGMATYDDETDSFFENRATYLLYGAGNAVYHYYHYLEGGEAQDRWYNPSNYKQYFKPEYRYLGSQYWGGLDYVFRNTVPIPAGTTGIYITFETEGEIYFAAPTATVAVARLTGGKKAVCGYQEGQVESSRPAYGGSNYVNTGICNSYTASAGVRSGNGLFTIVSEDIGFQTGQDLPGVAAPDLAPPGPVQTQGNNAVTGEPVVKKEAVKGSSGSEITIAWTAPQDRGSTYYHKAVSHLASTGTKLAVSNLTVNTLTTGVKGYYYVLNKEADTKVTVLNAAFTVKPQASVALLNCRQYLHVAAVDGAGNVGETGHIDIAPIDSITEISWPVYTEKLTIDNGENVYPGEDADTYFVRCDEGTPITLRYSAWMEGAAAIDYQINHMIFISSPEGDEPAKCIAEVPMHEIQSGEIVTSAPGLRFRQEGRSFLKSYSYAESIRSNKNRDIRIVRQFLVDEELEGRKLCVIPGAGVVSERYQVYSSEERDRGNSIFLIGDGSAPDVRGLEALEEVSLINQKEPFLVSLTAEDLLSGVADFYVEIYNEDNVSRKFFRGNEAHEIEMELTKEDPLFAGEFTVTVYAADHVGNERTDTFRVTEFALETGIERILAPHDPIFQSGESGILTIDTWGYIERVEVEFPIALTELDPGLNQTIIYDPTGYRQNTKLQFMIPLYTPEGNSYTITVRAFRGDRKLEDYPELSVMEVKGSILDDVRTRLR